MRVLVEHGEHLVRALVAQLVVDIVDRPEVVLVFRSQPDHRCIMMIKPLALLVPLPELQALITPQPLDLLVIDPPALSLKQLAHLAIPVAAILLGQPDQYGAKLVVILLSRPVLQGAALGAGRFGLVDSADLRTRTQGRRVHAGEARLSEVLQWSVQATSAAASWGAAAAPVNQFDCYWMKSPSTAQVRAKPARASAVRLKSAVAPPE